MTASAQVAVHHNPSAPARAAGNVFGVLQREIDRVFDEVGRASWAPLFGAGAAVSMDYAETKDGIELTAELPGLEEKDVKVTFADRMLTISGEKTIAKDEQDKNYRFVERSYGAFSRTVELPADVEADKITASLANGVLKVHVPRLAKAEPKQIEVKRAA